MKYFASFRNLILGALLAAPIAATAAPQPFLEAEQDLSGSLLNFFLGGIPSTLTEITLSSTVSAATNAPGTVGKTLAFKTDTVEIGGQLFRQAELTLGSTTLLSADILSNDPLGDFDPFTAGPGDLNFPMFIVPPFTDTPNAADPTLFDFTYGGDFDIYPDRIGVDAPEFEVLLSVYLAGPLPVRTFHQIDPSTNQVIDSFDFFEGPLSISRITLGPVGGLPDIAPIPLPAGLPLMLAAFGCLALLGRRRA
ncbi:hypothetical protein So717_00230 [Roseobacter cerasinus]|uniref:VPLPA-CTERM protein sorting domain-containing protein n=1 Tax=Roseobacter cerasinus TaxID=2602289 RepID=A0A640VLK1_9RHOB|nr:VPLPA-CTERM sorting domain-containing protein [Roseobacter cerasinus]GFE48270.1 hypothetical protein So717_00230 [Roseobacter cerasinus]